MPLALLPLALAIWVWLALGLLGAGSAIMLRPSWRANVPILFLFLPFYRAAVVKQATLIWVGLAILLILFVRRGKLPLAGLCVALLPAKPQTGLFFALAAVIWALRHDRRLLGWSIAWAILIWGAALLLLPDWPWRWVVALMRYQAVVHPLSILPLGLLVLLASWRLPWYAIAAAAQVVFFPLSDLYSALPLVLGWVAVGGPLAWVGAGISWLWSLLGQPNNETSLWLFVLLPYCVCALLRALIDQRSGRSWPLRDSMTIYFARQVSD
jgi:hypothetical protein